MTTSLEHRTPSPAEARRIADYLCDQMRVSAKALHLDIPPADTCRELRMALEAASRTDQQSMDRLRAAVCNYTALLRDKGTSIESALVSLKAVVNIHVVPRVAVDPAIHSRYTMKEMISRWAIEEYFSPSARGHTSA